MKRKPTLLFTRRVIQEILRFPRRLTSQMRLMPDFIIIGAQRCGTTSLYNYLIKHPSIAPVLKKEIHFFDLNFDKNVAWYRAHFPTSLYKNYVKKIRKQNLITGEASPYYLFHPHAPKRVWETIPEIKLIVLLRNPIDRAYSHYKHEVRIGVETLSFEAAIEKEKDRLDGEIQKMLKDEEYHSFNHQHYSYLARGIYVDQLKYWRKFFPKEQILILKSEDFFEDPSTILKQVTRFLNLSNLTLKKYGKYNYATYADMTSKTRKRLTEYFKPHNKKLYEYIGRDFGWNE